MSRFNLKTFSRFSYAFVPQYFRSLIFHDTLPAKVVHDTAWLDGLRGLAALCVYNHHFLYQYTWMIFLGWDGKDNDWAIDLPIIRVFYLGPPMVSTFFVVGGYVISLKPLQLIQTNSSSSREKLLQTTCSFTFRRFLRLYLPAFVSTGFVMVGTYLGLFDFVSSLLQDSKLFPGQREKCMTRYSSFYAQVVFWVREMLNLTNVYRPGYFYYPIHDLHLWTLPFEYRASLILTIALLGLAQTGNHFRLWTLSLLGLYCTYVLDAWDLSLFFWGSGIAQLDIIRNTSMRGEPNEIPMFAENEKPLMARVKSWFTPVITAAFRKSLFAAAFLIAMWLFTAPAMNVRVAPGYVWLSSYLVPTTASAPERILPGFGTVLLVLLLRECSPQSVGRLFLTRPYVQYLGKISFALYLVHGPILHMIGYSVPILIWNHSNREHIAVWTGGLLAGWAVSLFIVLCAADVFAREVDSRCVAAARWIEWKCTTKET